MTKQQAIQAMENATKVQAGQGEDAATSPVQQEMKMSYIAEYKGQKFVIEHSHGGQLGATPTPQPRPVKLDASRPWAANWPVRQERFVSAGQHYRPHDLADYL